MKTGSKISFHKWIDDIKKAYRHKTELEEKLEFYESRLINYKAVTYDSIGSGSNRNHVEEDLLYAISKIEETEIRIDRAQKLIKAYLAFKSGLKDQEEKVLEYLVETSLSKYEIARIIRVSKTRVYDIIFSIKRKRLGD